MKNKILMVPPRIIEINNRIYEACNGSDSLSSLKVAELIGVSDDVIRKAIYRGTCPFGIGYGRTKLENGFSRIPVLPFYNFMTQGLMYKMAQWENE